MLQPNEIQHKDLQHLMDYALYFQSKIDYGNINIFNNCTINNNR